MLTSLASAMIQLPISEFQYSHASFGTLYGQLDLPWFPVDDIPPKAVPRLSTDPIIQSSDAALYQRALLLLDETQNIFKFTFPTL